MHLAPGNPALMVAGPDASIEVVKKMEKKLGLDKPLYVQYLIWAKRVVQGDLGRSIRTKIPVVEEIVNYLPNTLALAAGSLVISTLVGIALGVISAIHRNTPLDNLVILSAVAGISAPSFVRALFIMWLFAITLRWFPISGAPDGSLLSLEGLKHMALPMLSLSLATLARLGRSSMLEVLNEDYIRTARAKGLTQRVVIYKHALKNAMLPLVTVLGFRLGSMFGGSVITETIFAWPGIGRHLITAIGSRDFPVVQAGVLMLALAYVSANLLIDVTYAYLDPRIRYD